MLFYLSYPLHFPVPLILLLNSNDCHRHMEAFLTFSHAPPSTTSFKVRRNILSLINLHCFYSTRTPKTQESSSALSRLLCVSSHKILRSLLECTLKGKKKKAYWDKVDLKSCLSNNLPEDGSAARPSLTSGVARILLSNLIPLQVDCY